MDLHFKEKDLARSMPVVDAGKGGRRVAQNGCGHESAVLSSLHRWFKEYAPDGTTALTSKRLRDAIQEAWESISFERIKKLVHSMKGRCQAVIDAEVIQNIKDFLIAALLSIDHCSYNYYP
jgi:hypothetical protein